LVIDQFKKHIETNVITLIDELSLSEKYRQIRPFEESSGIQKYQLGDITLEVYLF
jgi:hypothetical protein